MAIDSRIAEAIQTIGSIVDHDLNSEDLLEVAAMVDLLQGYALRTSVAKSCRLAGRIVEALNFEQQTDELYSMLSKECRW